MLLWELFKLSINDKNKQFSVPQSQNKQLSPILLVLVLVLLSMLGLSFSLVRAVVDICVVVVAPNNYIRAALNMLLWLFNINLK
jgi:hypothetical protein